MTPRDCFACRYLPAADDKVIGVVLERFGESFNVDVGGPFVATLSALAFEGAHVRLMPPVQRTRGVCRGNANALRAHCMRHNVRRLVTSCLVYRRHF